MQSPPGAARGHRAASGRGVTGGPGGRLDPVLLEASIGRPALGLGRRISDERRGARSGASGRAGCGCGLKPEARVRLPTVTPARAGQRSGAAAGRACRGWKDPPAAGGGAPVRVSPLSVRQSPEPVGVPGFWGCPLALSRCPEAGGTPAVAWEQCVASVLVSCPWASSLTRPLPWWGELFWVGLDVTLTDHPEGLLG